MEQKLIRKKHKALSEKKDTQTAEACTNLAAYYVDEGRYAESIEEYKKAAEIYRRKEMIIELACINRGIGESYMGLLNFVKALQHQNTYLDLCRKVSNKLEEQRALATIGHTYITKYLSVSERCDKTDLNLAYKFFMKSLMLCENLNNISKREKADMSARLFCNVGLVQECLKNYDKSEELLNKAIKLCEENDVYETLQRAYSQLASLKEKMNDFHSAIQNYNMSIDVASKLKDKTLLVCNCLSSKSDILIKLGDFNAAKLSLLKAYKMCTKDFEEYSTISKKLKIVVVLCRTEKSLVTNQSLNLEEVKKLTETMADCLSELNCFDKALYYYHKVREILEETNGDLGACYYSLAETYKDNKQYDLAIEYFEKEYDLCKDNLKNSLQTLCEIVDTKELAGCSSKEICDIYEKAWAKCKNCNNRVEEIWLIKRYLSYLRKTNRLSEKIDELEKILIEYGFSSSDSENESEENEMKTNIGEDISLDAISDDSEENPVQEIVAQKRKRRSNNFSVKRNAKGETQLHTACISGKSNVVSHLLERGHPVNIRDNGGWLPLHDACISGHYDIVEMLLDKGSAINDRGGIHCNGMTPLHDACVNGHLRVIRLLLDKGANVLAKTDDGETPYHILKKAYTDNQLSQEETESYQDLLNFMGAVLDKAGQSRELNVDVQNSALVSNSNFTTSSMRRSRPIDVEKRRGSIDDSDKSSDSDVSEKSLGKECRRIQTSGVTSEYQKVMDNLRHKNQVRRTSSSDVKKSVLVSTSDVVSDDDWLEDDLGLNKKRKIDSTGYVKQSTPEKQITKYAKEFIVTKQRNTKSSLQSETSPKKNIIENTQRILEELVACNSASNVDQNTHNENSLNWGVPFTESDDLNFDPVEVLAETEQRDDLFIIDTPGISRKSSTKLNQLKMSNFVSIHKDKENSVPLVRNSSKSPIKHMSDDPVIAIDVTVEGKPIRVTSNCSMKNVLTLKWLSMEVARRYAKKEYVEPVLELTTKSGAELVDEDYIGTLFVADLYVAELQARVVKWNLPSLHVRYKDACADMNIEPVNFLCEYLETMTVSLDLSYKGLQSKSMTPLCKALSRESKLLDINLSNNLFSVDCSKLFFSSLSSLDSLTRLNLSGTNLQTEDIKELAKVFSKSSIPILQNLRSLDLSENFFGDYSMKDLEIITSRLNLKQLNLSLLDFTENVFEHDKDVALHLRELENFNIRGNELDNKSLIRFISWLDLRKLKCLDISNNKITEGFVKSFAELVDNESFDVLNFTRCNVYDNEVFDLIRSCDRIKTINLSYNQLTSITLRRLLESSVVEHLVIIGCENMDKYFESNSSNLWAMDDFKKSLKISASNELIEMLIHKWREKYIDSSVLRDGSLLLLSNPNFI